MESYLPDSVMLRYKQMITGEDYIIASIIIGAEPILRFPIINPCMYHSYHLLALNTNGYMASNVANQSIVYKL